jgi:phosphatidylglycerophosphate synthase
MKIIRLNEIRRLSAKKNQLEFQSNYYFSSKISNYFSFLFINLGFSANQVTGILFMTGVLSCFSFLSNELVFVFIGYSLWRLHAIFDLCDGEVARFNKTFTFKGIYWDYMTHDILYPLCFVCINYSLYQKFGLNLFLYTAAFGSIVVSLIFSVKNTYYRAMLFNKIDLNNISNPNPNGSGNILRFVLNEATSFNGFLLMYLVIALFNVNSTLYLILCNVYLLFFGMRILLKFYTYSKLHT